MPVLRILNIWNTPVPEGLRNYGSGLALHSSRLAKRVAQGLHVLAIHSLPECSTHRLRGDADRCLRGALRAPRHSVPSGSRGRPPRGYPNCSGKQSPPRPRRRPGGRTPGSWLWSSTRQHKPFHTRRPTQPQRSCRHIDRRQSGGGMSLRGTVNRPQVHQVGFTGAARLRPGGTEQWSRMALWRGRTCRCPAAPALSVAHRVEEEHRHDLGRAAPRRGVALMVWMRRRLAKSCRTSTVVASSGGEGRCLPRWRPPRFLRSERGGATAVPSRNSAPWPRLRGKGAGQCRHVTAAAASSGDVARRARLPEETARQAALGSRPATPSSSGEWVFTTLSLPCSTL